MRAVDDVLDEILASTSLPFLREFLRSRNKPGERKVLIGTTRGDARRSLRDALSKGYIQLEDLESWYREIEGWGRQHLYLGNVSGNLYSIAHLQTAARLRAFLKKHDLLGDVLSDDDSHPSRLEDVVVDDVYVHLIWRARCDKWERCTALDKTQILNDEFQEAAEGDEYQFRAWRRIPTRAASRFCVRKTDGAALILLTQALGEDHDAARAEVQSVAETCLGSCVLTPLCLAPAVGSLDANAVASYQTAIVRHGVTLDVESREARFRADGARVQFESMSQSQGYTASEPVRRVRRAMQVERFVGEKGKFRLTYDIDGSQHKVVASLDAHSDRTYLHAKMKEAEVWAFADRLLDLV